MSLTQEACLRLERLSALDDVDEHDWQAIASAEGFYASRRFMVAFERIEPADGVRSSVLVVRGPDGEPLCLLPVHESAAGETGRYEPLEQVRAIEENSPEELWRPAVVLGGRAGYDNRVFTSPSASRSVRAEAFRLAFSQAVGSGGVAWAYSYLNTSSAHDFRAAVPDQGEFVLAGADCVLDVPDGGFDAYLGALSKNGRSQVRRDMRKFAEIGCEVEFGVLRDHYDEVAGLLACRLRKYGSVHDEQELARILREDGAVHGDDALVLIARLGGEAIAFVSLFRWRHELVARSWGFRDGFDGEGALYFNLVYYEPLRRAAELGVRKLRFNILSYEAKVRRGARFDPRWTVLAPGQGSPGLDPLAVDAYNERQLRMFQSLGDAPWEEVLHALRRGDRA